MDDLVWKVHLTEIYMLAETRDGVKKRFNLLCIDTRTMQVIWKTEAAALGWWETIVAVTDRYIVLSHYRDPALPYTGGMKVMDLSNGSFLWENSKYNLAEVKSDDLVRVMKMENDHQDSKEVDLDTGEIVSKVSESISEVNRIEKDRMITPSFYPEDHEYFLQVAAFLRSRGYHPVRAIEYTEIEDKVIIGFYEEVEPGFKFILLVINSKGDTLWEGGSMNQSEGIGLGMYFLLKEWIVFVRDKKEIVILSLSI